MSLNLYLISQDVNSGYDTYDSAIVCAESEDEARAIAPFDTTVDASYWIKATWAFPENVQVEFIGVAGEGVKRGVVLASFNAG